MKILDYILIDGLCHLMPVNLTFMNQQFKNDDDASKSKRQVISLQNGVHES